MTMKDNKIMLEAMIRHCAVAFEGKFDRAGEPYVLHLLKVMHYLRSEDEELRCIAIGHDLFEDTKSTMNDLVRLGISQRVILGILHLTKMPGENYETYKEKVKSNPDAVRVKLADLRHNSDIRRLKGVSPKDIERTQRYMEFHAELKALIDS